MRQPVSRISFDRRRGFLGVQLQEGALFVDAAWNEASAIAWSQLRDAIIAGGVVGTSGRELRIDPIEDRDTGRLLDLRVCGTGTDDALAPRPFYCDGLPVLWPADLRIDAQPIGDAFRSEATGDRQVPAHGTWIDLLQDQPYEIYLRARLETFDRFDDPFLDDPGLDATRGTFRLRVASEVRIRKADPDRPPAARAATNVKLSVDGSYLSDLNVLYRVELDASNGTRATPTASLVWDPDAAATVARVVDTADEGARLVMVDSTEGFDSGFVRFEGPGINRDLYRVMKAPGLEGVALRVTRHRCDRPEVSLAAWQATTALQHGQAADIFNATFSVPAAAQPGGVLAIEAGDIVTALPASLGAADSTPWVILAIAPAGPPAQPGQLPPQAITFGPAGLTQPLRTLGAANAVKLRLPARQFDATITVEHQPSWTIGMRISVIPPADLAGGVSAQTVAVREDRMIVRIEHVATQGTMVVRLDQPLAYDHAPGATVAPQQLIRARRFAGHECHLAIDRIGRTDPGQAGVASIANFSTGQALADGLSLHLTIEQADELRDGQVQITPGDGWHFAARGDGWVETRMYAPVEDPPASELALAQLTINAEGYALIDLRPVPAALAIDDELARIGAAATALAESLGNDPAVKLVAEIARLTAYPRVQPQLLLRLEQLVVAQHSKLYLSPPCRAWLDRLARAVNDVTPGDDASGGSAPTRRQIAAIGFAIGGLAYVSEVKKP